MGELITQQAWWNDDGEAWPQVLAHPWRPDEDSRVAGACLRASSDCPAQESNSPFSRVKSHNHLSVSCRIFPIRMCFWTEAFFLDLFHIQFKKTAVFLELIKPFSNQLASRC